MTHYNTILSQITAFIPRHDFDYHADIHHSGQKFRFLRTLEPVLGYADRPTFRQKESLRHHRQAESTA